MKFSKLTKPELEEIMKNANFTDEEALLRGVFNIVHYILINRNIPQFYDVSHEILILYNSLYIHINKQKMVHYWYMNGTWKKPYA